MNNRNHRNRYRKTGRKCGTWLRAGIAAVFLCVLFFQVWRSYHCLVVREWEISSEKLDQEICILVISDLHDASFGKENEDLVERIDKEAPDLVVMDGDMINGYTKDCEGLFSLIRQLSQTRPVYIALGNHELQYMESHPQLTDELQAAGAAVLEQEYVDIMVGDQRIRLGGLYEYAFGLGSDKTDELKKSDFRTWSFLTEFQDTDAYKIMLCHRPDSFIFGEAADTWNVDLVISGHVHGGQVVLPFVGGLWAPDQGWLPKYVSGVHELGQIQLAITSGLGSQREKLPRFNNPAEIMILNLKPDQPFEEGECHENTNGM